MRLVVDVRQQLLVWSNRKLARPKYVNNNEVYMLTFGAWVESQQSNPVRSKDEEAELAKISPIFQPTQYQGWKIQTSVHAAAQAYDRRPDFEFNDWKDIHRRAINALDKKANGDFIIFSKSFDQGYVVNANARLKTLRIITVLPKGRKNPKPGTDVLIVENVDISKLILVLVD